MSSIGVTGPIARLEGRTTAHSVAVILRARLQGFANAVRNTRAGRLKVAGTVVVALLVAFGIGLLSSFFGAGVSALSPEVLAEMEASGVEFALDPKVLHELVPRAVLTLSLVLLLLSTFSSLLGALYLGDDMPRLLTSPTPVRAVFLAKFLEAAVQPTGLLLIFGLPVLIGYGIAIRAGALYHAASVLLFLLMPFAALGISALATLALVRVLPARRASEALRVIGALAGLGMYFGSQTLMQDDDPAALLRGLSRAPDLLGVGAGWAIATPWTWPAESVLAAAGGRTGAAIGWALGFAVLAAAVVVVAVVASERLYLDGWAKAEGDGSSRRRGSPKDEDSAARGTLGAWHTAARRSPTLAIALKDLRLIRRDLRGWSMMIWPLAIGMFWLWQAATDSGGDLLDSGPLMLRAASISAALFVAGSIGLRIAMEGISRDAASVHIAITAPISGQSIVAGKLLIAYCVSLIAGLILLGAFALIAGMDPRTAFLDISIIAIALAGQAAIGVAAGAVRPVFDWTDPQKIVGGGTGCLTWIAVLAFSAIVVGVGLGPSIIATLFGVPGWLAVFGPLGALALTTAVVMACVTWAGERVEAIER